MTIDDEDELQSISFEEDDNADSYWITEEFNGAAWL